MKDQAVDIRRFIVASLDSFASRIVSEVRDMMPLHSDDPIAPPPPPPRSTWGGPGALLAACIVAGVFAASWFVARNEAASARAEIAALRSANGELQRSRTDLSATIKDLTAALAAANSNAASGAAGGAGGGPASAAGAAVVTSRVEAVPYGEIPFDRSRLDVLRDLLMKLEAQGFHGVLRITNLAGIFCLTGNGTDGYTLAAPNAARQQLRFDRQSATRTPCRASNVSRWRLRIWSRECASELRARYRRAGKCGHRRSQTTPYPARTESPYGGRVESRRGGQQSGGIFGRGRRPLRFLERDADEEFRALGGEVEIPACFVWVDSRFARTRL